MILSGGDFTGFAEFTITQSSYTSLGLNKNLRSIYPKEWRKTKYPITIPKVKNCPKGLSQKKTLELSNKTYRFTPSKTVRGYENHYRTYT